MLFMLLVLFLKSMEWQRQNLKEEEEEEEYPLQFVIYIDYITLGVGGKFVLFADELKLYTSCITRC